MKHILAYLLFLTTCLAQVSPPAYTPPRPYPTNGTTVPNGSIRWSGPIDRSSYSDGPLIWPRTILGSQQGVATLAERDSIITGRRQEMMTAWVVDIGYGTNTPGLYLLHKGIANSNWVLLGTVTNSVFVPTGSTGAGSATTIYNNDSSLLGDRIVDQNSNDLSFINSTLFDVVSPATTVELKLTTAALELKATGSNKLNFHTDAIEQGTATVGQVPVLSNTSTGGWEWGDGTSPSSGNVTTVDTINDIISESTSVVITQGYYSVGDGGHAAYRYVSGDVTATNTVTVFEGAAGRYFLMQSGSISAKQAGALGDGSTDDHDALQTLFDNCPNITARLEPLSYRVVGQLNPPDGVKVIARGATVTIETTSECGVAASSNFTWDGGTVVDAAQNGGSSDNLHCPFRFGDYSGVANAGVSNCVLKNVTFYSTGYAGVGVLVTQNSHNITVENFEIPSTSSMGGAIESHWGFVTDGDATAGTRHPHDVKVRNGHVGSMTTADCAGLIVSASYDIDYGNVSFDQCRYPIFAVCGDFGYRYSGLQGQQLGSVKYHNITCLDSLNAGAYMIGLDSDSVQRNLNYVVDNCTLIGPNAGAGLGGLYLDNVRNLTVLNTVISGHQYGTIFTNGCANVTFQGCLFATNALGGLVLSDPSTTGVTARGNRFQNNSASLSGTNAAGIRITAGSNHRILDNDIGDPVTEANQEVGLLCIPGAVNVTITGNNVLNVKGGGVDEGYYLGNSVDTGHLFLVSGNTANATTLMVGPDQIPYTTRGKYRVFTGTGTPTVGTYLKGDMVVFNEATASPFAKVCSVAGTPGTWVTAY